jgi:hypothetical protein
MHRGGEFFAFCVWSPLERLYRATLPLTYQGQGGKGLLGSGYGCTRIVEGASAPGRATRKVVPPESDVTTMLPPIASVKEAAMASPRPAPAAGSLFELDPR